MNMIAPRLKFGKYQYLIRFESKIQRTVHKLRQQICKISTVVVLGFEICAGGTILAVCVADVNRVFMLLETVQYLPYP